MEPNVQGAVNQPVTTPTAVKQVNFLPMIIVGIVMLLLGLGGGYLLFANKTQVKQTETTQVSPTVTQQANPTSSVSPTNPTAASEKSSSPFLEITELNVKLNISQLTGLTYKYKINSTGDKTAILYTPDLAVYCSPDAADAPLGVIFKINGQYSDIPLPKPGELLKQAASYFISYRPPQQQCTNNSTGGQLQGEQEQKVKSILTSLESL